MSNNKIEITLTVLKCPRCNHSWIPRKPKSVSVSCPKCQICLYCKRTRPNCKCKPNI